MADKSTRSALLAFVLSGVLMVVLVVAVVISSGRGPEKLASSRSVDDAMSQSEQPARLAQPST